MFHQLQEMAGELYAEEVKHQKSWMDVAETLPMDPETTEVPI